MRRIGSVTIAALLLITLIVLPASGHTAKDRCEGDSALDLSVVKARFKDSDEGRVWRFVIETCEAFAPSDLAAVDGGNHYAMSLHFDTTRLKQVKFERTLEIWNCVTSIDQVCATM